MKANSKDSLGDRMKAHEDRTRYFLPMRTFTVIRLDGKSFHTFTRGCKKPFDRDLMDCMQFTALKLCEEIQNVKLAYTQSDEITLILTDFDGRTTSPWFGGNLQKMVSVSASIATAEFNKHWGQVATKEFFEELQDDEFDHHGLVEEILKFQLELKSAHFDSRAYTVSEAWEAYNAVYWRQNDASKNSVQMLARSLFPHKELQNAKIPLLHDMIHSKGENWNDQPTDCKRGAFVVYDEGKGWRIDRDAPILSQDKAYFFDKVPLYDQYRPEINEVVFEDAE